MTYILLIAAGFLAGAINVMAGGGSMLTIPALIFLGLESTVANGTNRVAILFQSIFAVKGFHGKGMWEPRRALALSLCAIPGAIAGAIVSARLSNEMFNKVLAVVLLVAIATLFVKKPQRNHPDERGTPSVWLYPALVLVGFYGGFIQIGVGFLFMVTLYHLLRVSLVRVNMHKVFIILIYTIPALLVFALSGKVDWKMGLTLAIGNSLGAYVASHVSVRVGDKWIRAVTACAVAIMAGKLLLN